MSLIFTDLEKAPAPQMKKCASRSIIFITFTLFTLTSTFVGFSLYTVPKGHVGYVEGTNGSVGYGVHIQLPWLPKPEIIGIRANIVNLDNYESPSKISIKTLRLRYSVRNVYNFFKRIQKYGTEQYIFSLKVEALKDIDSMFSRLTNESALNVTENEFLRNVYVNSTDVELLSVVFSTPTIVR
jgi:hypothetical protein